MEKNQSDTYPARQKAALSLILFASFLAAVGLLLYGPIPQDPLYHQFSDQRTLFNIPNFWNVVSNLPFLAVGMIGLHRCKDGAALGRISCPVFFAGVLLTGLGSAYYHLQPDDLVLFWDRLAMAVTFMAFLSIIIGDFINRKLGEKLLVPLVLYGIFSTVYWITTGQLGMGDLRFYAVTQFLPMVIIPIIALGWRSATVRMSDIMIIGAGYGLAKVFEALDVQLYEAITFGGHALKHLAAAGSAYWMLIILDRDGHTAVSNQHHS